MTLQTEIEADAHSHAVGYYVVFDGISTRLATHDPGDGETYVTGMSMPRGSGQQLDRRKGVVKPGGFSIDCSETPDGHLRQLFARRGGAESPLAAGLDNTATTIEVIEQAWDDGATVYVGRETITLGTYTASPSPRYTGCTRGAEGSIAVEHQAGHAVSTKPRHWLGRRAVLYEFNLATGTAAAVRAGILEASPKWQRGTWMLDVLDLTTLLNRPICSGWSEEKVLGMEFGSSTITFEVDDASLFAVSSRGRVRITIDDEDFYYAVSSIDTVSTPNKVVCADDLGVVGRRITSDMARADATIRQIALIKDTAANAALYVMLSRFGTSGSSYDVLPGVAPDIGDGTFSSKQMGAGLPEDWVDVDAWAALSGIDGALPTFVLDESMHLLDFLVREVTWRLGGFIYITNDGKLSFRRYEPATADSSLAVYNEGDLASVDIVYLDDEEEVLSGAVIESNWDYEERKYTHRTNVTFSETQSVYGDERDVLRISSRTLRVGAGSSHLLASQPIAESDLTTHFLRLYARTYLGLQRVKVAFRWQHHLRLYVGHRFKLSLAYVPNGEGGEGFASQIFEVISIDPQTDNGRVEVTCDLLPTGKVIAPRMEVSSVSSNTLYLYGRTDLFPEPATLAQFPVNCQVRIFDASASPPFSVSEVETVVANPAMGEIELAALPSSFTVAAGDHVKLIWTADTGNPNDLGADVNDHAMVANASGQVNGSRDTASRWQ